MVLVHRQWQVIVEAVHDNGRLARQALALPITDRQAVTDHRPTLKALLNSTWKVTITGTFIGTVPVQVNVLPTALKAPHETCALPRYCLLYTSDAADDLLCVD